MTVPLIFTIMISPFIFLLLLFIMDSFHSLFIIELLLIFVYISKFEAPKRMVPN